MLATSDTAVNGIQQQKSMPWLHSVAHQTGTLRQASAMKQGTAALLLQHMIRQR
jgi:hypothetical protein